MDKVTLFDYFKYLKPEHDIEGVFLAVIIVLGFGTALWVWHSTRERKGKMNCWEQRWTNNTRNTCDDLKVEYGSIHELSSAVELPAEKLADVLPSMFLVIGLLGTFLGIGVALNEAAGVLNNSNVNPVESMGNAQKAVGNLEQVTKSKNLLDEMMGMLDGLGALFKSSIYGIIGFFGFTLWKNKWGSDKERFKWCVERCNKEIEIKEKIQDKNTNKIITALNKVNDSIGESIADCIQKSLQTALVKGFENVNKNLNEMNSALCLTLEKSVVEQFRSLNKEMQNQVNETKAVVLKLEDVGESIADCIQKSLQTALVKGFENVNKNLNEMNSALCLTLEKSVVEQFRSLNKEMQNQVNETKAVVLKLEGLANNSETQTNAMDSLSQTMTEQFAFVANSAKSMGFAAETLAKSVDEFRPAVTGTLEAIRNQFIKSITDSSKVMENAGISILHAVNEMSEKSKEGQDNLDKTLSDFNKRINGTLVDIKQTTLTMEEQGNKYVKIIQELNEEIGQKLASISVANLNIRAGMKKLPEELSQAIKGTLQEVKQSIKSSTDESTQSLTKALEEGFHYVAEQNALVAKERRIEKVESVTGKE